MVLTPLLITVAFFPTFHLIRMRVLQALSASQQNEWIRRNWWDKWYSWLFVGGPPGRWIVGTVLGVRDLQVRESAARAQEIGYHPGDNVAFVGVGLLATFGFAVLLSLVASVSESNRPDMGHICKLHAKVQSYCVVFSDNGCYLNTEYIFGEDDIRIIHPHQAYSNPRDIREEIKGT